MQLWIDEEPSLVDLPQATLKGAVIMFATGFDKTEKHPISTAHVHKSQDNDKMSRNESR